MVYQIRNKLALVTGGSRNIGAAISLALEYEEVRLVIVSKSRKSLNEIKSRLKNPSQHIYIELNLIRQNAVTELISHLDKLGIKELDIIVHNLGGSLGITSTTPSEQEWIEVWRYNLGISIQINNYYIEKMCKKDWGRIVHISSSATKSGGGYPAYISAKAALESYVLVTSKYYSKNNVLINVVSPGLVRLEGRYFSKLEKDDPLAMKKFYSDNLPISRMAEPEEIAEGVLFLCSDKSSYMSGAVLRIDGGMR